MAITDFMDLSLLEQVLEDWTISTGMSAVAIDKDENYITKEFGYTDFYEKYHRSAADDLRRHISRNDSDISWFTHSGLTYFTAPIQVAGSCVGKIIAGQFLAKEPDDDVFSTEASEQGINPDAYLEALHQVPVKEEAAVQAAARLLQTLVNNLANLEYNQSSNSSLVSALEENISKAADLIDEINGESLALDKIESKQKILSLNASIEAARAGEFGRGFAVVASEFGKLAVNSGEINKSIKTSLKSLTSVINELEEQSK